MKCPNHITKDVAGYCSVCGAFVCDICLGHHEGNAYCPKHFKPIAASIKLKEEGVEGRLKHGRHHLVVHYLDGGTAQGTCRSMNIKDSGFYLECEDDSGISTNESIRIQFVDVKYVANVKSFTGKFDHHQKFQQYTPGGSHVVVRLRDGEIVEGVTMHTYVPDQPRFYVIPIDPQSNNINVLVEKSAIERVFSPDDYRELLKREKEKIAQQKEQAKAARSASQANTGKAESGGAEVVPSTKKVLSQEESMGDFYFETHNYPSALEQYSAAGLADPESPRLKKKRVVTTVNIGIQYIKSREYPAALEYMEQALEIEPNNPHAKKKAKQLRKVIEKTERRMREYYEQQTQGGEGGEEL